MCGAEEQPQTIRTLDRWIDSLLKVPLTIECPLMQILGRDFEPPLFTGSGSIHVRSRTQMGFVMHAIPRDDGESFKRIRESRQNPDDILYQFRVLATDYNGTKWNGGWTELRLGETLGNVWRLSGEIAGLTTGVSDRWVAPESSVEVAFDCKLRLPIPMNMVTSVRQGDHEVLRSREPGTKTVDVAGTKVKFFHAPEGEVIWATANTSAVFSHPYAENWISEPLCLLLGELVFPRLVARNFGNSEATIWLRPSPPLNFETVLASILGEDPYAAHDRFWDLYRDILTMLVNARDKSGRPNFEAHPLTRYYHEIAQASTGSHWVICLTLASMIEGVVKMIVPDSERKSDYTPTDIKSLRQHVAAWEGNNDLRQRILNSVTLAESKGIGQSLKALLRQGSINIKGEHIETWERVRNQVMHGHLISPWLDQELERRLRLLIELAHRLSTAYVRKCISLL